MKPIILIQHQCVCCTNKITKIDGLKKDDDFNGMFSDGLVQKVEAGYGSVLDGNMYYIAICDDCLKTKQKQGIIHNIGNYMEDYYNAFDKLNDDDE